MIGYTLASKKLFSCLLFCFLHKFKITTAPYVFESLFPCSVCHSARVLYLRMCGTKMCKKCENWTSLALLVDSSAERYHQATVLVFIVFIVSVISKNIFSWKEAINTLPIRKVTTKSSYLSSDVRWQFIWINELALWSVYGKYFAQRRALQSKYDFELQHQIRPQSIPEPITSVTQITARDCLSLFDHTRVDSLEWAANCDRRLKMNSLNDSLIKWTRSSKFVGC